MFFLGMVMYLLQGNIYLNQLERHILRADIGRYSLEPELSIRFQYLDDRKNPAEVFEAMGLYINAYRDLGQLMTNSIGIKTDFEFKLNAIESGSILSKLSTLPGKLDSMLEFACYNSGNRTFQELVDIEETETEEQVDLLASNLEDSLSDFIPNQIASPHIDRQKLAFVLEAISKANEKVKQGESVTLKNAGCKKQDCEINTAWRFTGDPIEMFQGKTEKVTPTLSLLVKIAVNEGGRAWTFRSVELNKVFDAKILDEDWLARYQAGLITPIGPKDVITAEVSYDLYTPPKGGGDKKIRSAKITKVIDTQRNSGFQHELEA